MPVEGPQSAEFNRMLSALLAAFKDELQYALDSHKERVEYRVDGIDLSEFIHRFEIQDPKISLYFTFTIDRKKCLIVATRQDEIDYTGK